jgi:uncharacterized protein with FMN-binding domain
MTMRSTLPTFDDAHLASGAAPRTDGRGTAKRVAALRVDPRRGGVPGRRGSPRGGLSRRGRTTTTRRATTTTTRAPTSKQSLTGPAVDTQYGPVQVRVTLQGGRIVDVAALQLPNDRSRSVEISNYAAPQLRDEVLRAQSAKIDVVSGATYTSQGYIQSLQAALDSANAG